MGSGREHGLSRRALVGVSVGMAMAGAGAKAAGRKPGAPVAKAPLAGLYPIGQTPFTPADKLDHEALAAEVRFCDRGRVNGFIWPQIASGWTTLSPQERLDGAETVLAAGRGGRTALVVGVQTLAGDAAGAAWLAEHAARHGADAIISLPPEKAGPDAVLEYYRTIGKATELPLLAQSVGDMSVDLLVRMAEQIPTLRCVKDEAGDPLLRIKELRARTGDRIAVFAGNGVRLMIEELQLGFKGFCPTTGLADVYQQAFDLWQAGQKRAAFDMFGRIQAFASIRGANEYILTARGVFKETTTSRARPGANPARQTAPLDAAQKRVVRESLDLFLRPYLRA